MRWLYNIMAKQSAPPVFTFNCKINIFETACNSRNTESQQKYFYKIFLNNFSAQKMFEKKPLNSSPQLLVNIFVYRTTKYNLKINRDKT